MNSKTFDIYHDLDINSTLEKVYAAISEPEHLINWWPKICEGNVELASVYRLYFSDEYDWKAKVIKCIPPTAFHLKMFKSDADWAPTSFGYDLKPIPKGTRLSFWHKGWPELNHHYRRSSHCWALLLQGMKDYIEKGEIIPFDHRA